MLLACGQCPSSSVGQSSTVLTSWSRDRGPPRARPYAALVQSGARRPFKPEVTGSSPVRGTYCHLSEVAQLVEQAAVNRKVGGSRPSLGAIHDHLAPIGRRMKVAQALLLNASYEPIHLVSVRRAVLLVLRQKAEVVEESDKVIRSETLTIPVPSVIRLVHFVRIPYQATAKLSHKALVAREPRALRLLRWARRDRGPHRATLPRWQDGVEERRPGLQGLQPQESGQAAVRDEDGPPRQGVRPKG